MLHNIAEICKCTGKTRSEIYAMLNNGKISFQVTPNGKRMVDTSELMRIFPEIDRSTWLQEAPKTELFQPNIKAKETTQVKEMQDLRLMISDLKNQVEAVLSDNRKLLRLLDYQAKQHQSVTPAINHTPKAVAQNIAENEEKIMATDLAKEGWQQYQAWREKNSNITPNRLQKSAGASGSKHEISPQPDVDILSNKSSSKSTFTAESTDQKKSDDGGIIVALKSFFFK